MYASENFSDLGRFSTPPQYVHWLWSRPRTLRTVQRQAASRAFDKGECNGVWHCKIRKAPAVLKMLKHFVWWLRKSSQVTDKGPVNFKHVWLAFE